MKITEFSPDRFRELKPYWTELEKGKEMTWFQTFQWYEIVNSHFLSEKRKALFRSGAYILVTGDGGEPVLIAPVQIIAKGFAVKGIGLKKGFYFIGRQGFSDYLNFIYKDFDSSALGAALSYLNQRYKISYCCFENVEKGSAVSAYFNSLRNVETVESFCMRIDLPEDFETYRKSLSKSVRQNIRTAFNRSERDGKAFRYEILKKIDRQTAEKLMEIRRPRIQSKQKVAYQSMSPAAKLYTKARNWLVDFTSYPIDVMGEIGDCWCFIVHEHDDVAAFYYSVYKPENKTVYLLLAGVDEKYAWYSPGVTQLYNFMKDETAAGRPDVEVIDLTRGNEKYKYDINAREIVTVRYAFMV